jgi:hypothetical protein
MTNPSPPEKDETNDEGLISFPTGSPKAELWEMLCDMDRDDIVEVLLETFNDKGIDELIRGLGR